MPVAARLVLWCLAMNGGLSAQPATPLTDRITGALYGVAVGEAMGAPQEGMPPEEVQSKYLDWSFLEFIPPRRPNGGKGDGHITDDTLMTEALMRAYTRSGDHLDAYGFRDFLLPEVTQTIVWVPERKQEMAIIGRLNPIEKYAVLRLNDLGVWPRIAGSGGVVNCGVAMYVMPVGAVNAGDPAAAYLEAAAIGAAESESYGVEAAGALAAAYAAAFAPGSSIESVLSAAQKLIRLDTESLRQRRAGRSLTMWSLYRDNTIDAVKATLDATDPSDDVQAFARKVRAAYLPYETASIEEVPAAFAAFKYGQGDFIRTIKAAVMYGRDNDSIAGMACGLLGAMRGAGVIPEQLRAAADKSNRRDFTRQAREFAQVVKSIYEKDAARWSDRTRAIRGGL
jgi:ADP-ribosylglycohydrolase